MRNANSVNVCAELIGQGIRFHHGKVNFKLPGTQTKVDFRKDFNLRKNAKLFLCRKYRYALWRTWDDSKAYAMIIGLNPSTADETKDDPTLIRCINFAKAWGYGGVCMANLFAFRATDPSDMKGSSDPIGMENNIWLAKLSKDAGVVVAAWGNDGAYLGRSSTVKDILPNLYCIKMNKSGEPAHPLYLKGNLIPIPMTCSKGGTSGV